MVNLTLMWTIIALKKQTKNNKKRKTNKTKKTKRTWKKITKIINKVLTFLLVSLYGNSVKTNWTLFVADDKPNKKITTAAKPKHTRLLMLVIFD